MRRYSLGRGAAYHSFRALILGTIFAAMPAFATEDTVTVVDCSGIPRLTEELASGSSVSLIVERDSSLPAPSLTLEQGEVKLLPTSGNGSLKFSPLDAGTWRLCGGSALEMRFERVRSGSGLATAALISTGVAGGVIGLTMGGSGSSDDSSQNGSGLTSGSDAPKTPSAGNDLPEPPADASKYPIGSEAEPLSPFR